MFYELTPPGCGHGFMTLLPGLVSSSVSAGMLPAHAGPVDLEGPCPPCDDSLFAGVGDDLNMRPEDEAIVEFQNEGSCLDHVVGGVVGDVNMGPEDEPPVDFEGAGDREMVPIAAQRGSPAWTWKNRGAQGHQVSSVRCDGVQSGCGQMGVHAIPYVCAHDHTLQMA